MDNSLSSQSANATQEANKTGNNYNKASNNYFGCNSFSGSDMVAIMSIPGLQNVKGTYTLGSLQTLSISTNMQRSPIRSIGNVNAKDYVMGPRTIAGSLVFAVFDKHFAYEAMESIQGDIGNYYFLADELPPFDITVTMANEYGKVSKLVIYGVRLVNEGQVMSVNDIYIENTYQFVAKDYDYLSDKTGATSDYIYEPLTARADSASEPISITDIEEPDQDDQEITIKDIKVIANVTNELNNNDTIIPGFVSLKLNIIQEDGFIIIRNTDQEELYKFDLSNSEIILPVTQILDVGTYDAIYKNTNEETSEPTGFEIKQVTSENENPSKPIIIYQEKNNNNYIIGLKASDNVSKGIRYTLLEELNDDETYWVFKEFEDKECKLELNNNKIYVITSYNNNKYSAAIYLNTDGEKEILFSDFKTYIINNKNKISSNYFNLFENLWLKVINYNALTKNTNSISFCFNAIKKDIVDAKLLEACNYFLSEALKYENDINAYNNEINVVSAPIVVDDILSIIEFEQNVTNLVITGGKTPSIIESDSFTRSGSKYKYQLKYSEGLYTVVAKEKDKESAPINVNVYDEKTKNKLLELRNNQDQDQTNNINLIAVRNECFDKIIKNDSNYLIFNEILFNENRLSNCVSEPIITENSSKQLVVDVNFIGLSDYYICLDEAADLRKNTLVFRVALNKYVNTYTFLKSKYALVDKTRYCLWIENNNGEIISNINSFEFGVSDSETTQTKNSITIKEMKSCYSMNENSSILDSYEIDQEINPFNLFDEIIVNNFNLPLTHANRQKLIADSINAKMNYYNKSFVNFYSSTNVNKDEEKIVFSTKLNQAHYDNIMIGLVFKDHITHYSIDYNDAITLQCNDLYGFFIQYRFLEKNQITRAIAFDNITNSILLNGGSKVEVV